MPCSNGVRLRKTGPRLLEELKSENLVYAEITFSIHRHVKTGIWLPDIGAWLEEEASHAGIEVQWILGPVSGYGREAGAMILQDVIAFGCQTIGGVTLAGRAHFFAPAEFAAGFALAWDRGLRLAAHARQMPGPQTV